MRRRLTSLFTVLAVVGATLAASGPALAQTEDGPRLSDTIPLSLSDRPAPDRDELVQVFIQLEEPSVAQFVATAGTTPSADAQRAQANSVEAQQDRVAAELASLIVEERARLSVAVNGIKAMVRAGDVTRIAATEGVKSVGPVAQHYPLNETSVPWIGADAVHTDGTTGDGITIAVIDTGIDYHHASFAGTGNYDDNNPNVVEGGSFPTAKVIGGFDFAGPTYDASSGDPDELDPDPDPDPLDVNGHGTHVAATAAGVETANVGHGVAPDASLLALKVFGDIAGSTDLVAEAIELSLDPDGDNSTDDAVDVINMSLGADFGHPNDPSALASQAAAEMGVVVVAASGNAGPVPYITGSPANAPGALSVAASVDGGVEALALEVNSPAEIADLYEAQPGDFGSLDAVTTGDLEEPSNDPLGCEPYPGAFEGPIAFVQRGVCDFTVKVANAEAGGATGVLVYNNVDGPPIAMGQNGDPDQPDIPAVMISLEDGELIDQTLAEEPVNVSMSNQLTIALPELADTMAGFTSRGPGGGSTFKPEVSAPGFNIESAAVGTGNGAALNSGTSMATPHVAGVAALLAEAHPGAEGEAIKSLIMNSAGPAEPDDGSVPLASQGNGVVQADRAALDLRAYTTPAALSFGRLNPIEDATVTGSVDINRLGGGNATYDVAIVANQAVPGVTWSASSAAVTTTGGSAELDVTLTIDADALPVDESYFTQTEADGWVVLTNRADADDEMVVGLMAVVDPASTVSAAAAVNYPPGVEPVAFADVPPSHLFYSEIIWLAQNDITRGCNPPANDQFCPDDDVSRGQMAAFLNRALSLPSSDTDFFTDDDDDIFEDDINNLAAAGITTGCNPPANDRFCPERFLSRAEMATFMVRGFDFTEGQGSDLFTDDDDNIHEWAIDILGTAGVTRGCNPPANDQFCPDRNIIRGEMAAFIFRAFVATGMDVPPPLTTSVTLANAGPSEGTADGFTLAAQGDDLPGGVLEASSWRTDEVSVGGDGLELIEFGIAMSEPWSSLSSHEIDIFIDVDQDGADDYVLVAADLGLLTGTGATGQVVTALIDLTSGEGFIRWVVEADYNDRVAILPIDLRGEFGFLADGDSAFDIDVVTFDLALNALTGVQENLTVNLGAELTNGLNTDVAAGDETTLPFTGTAEMAWLFSRNPVSDQVTILGIGGE